MQTLMFMICAPILVWVTSNILTRHIQNNRKVLGRYGTIDAVYTPRLIMQIGSPIEAVSSAIYHAAHIAFSDIHYQDRDWDALQALGLEERQKVRLNNDYPLVSKVRRPEVREVQVTAMFPQTWPSTALGFGGIGGAAMTPAYTVVVRGPTGQAAVYWAGRHAYTIELNSVGEDQRKNFESDVSKQWTIGLNDAGTRYGALSSRTSVRQDKVAKTTKSAAARMAEGAQHGR